MSRYLAPGELQKHPKSPDDITAQRRQATIQNMLAMYAGFSWFVGGRLGGSSNVFWYAIRHRNPKNPAPFEYALIAGAMFIALSSLFFGTRVILGGLSSPNVVLPPQDRTVTRRSDKRRQ